MNKNGLMSTAIKSIPTLVTLLALAGVGYLGHHTGWKIPSAKALFGGEDEASDDWCMDHGVPESSCLICRGFRVSGTPPSVLAKQGESESNKASEDEQKKSDRNGEENNATGTTEGKKLPAVQLATADVLRLAGVETGKVESRSMDEIVSANAEVRYDMTRYAQIAARTSGLVIAVQSEVGQRVAKGDVLAVIDAAEVGRLKAEFLQAAAQLEVRSKAMERSRVSVEKRIGTEAEFQEAQASLREAQIRLYNTRQALINLGLPAPELKPGQVPRENELQFLGLRANIAESLNPSQATANLMPIVSPLDGTVISRALVAGEAVEAGKALFTVADTSHMWVIADLPMNELGCVKLGHELEFMAEGLQGEPVRGRVSWISTEVDERTRTVQVRADVDNSDGRLFAHMFGRVRITVRKSEASLVVPKSAVQGLNGSHVVFVRANDEVFETREVAVGVENDGFIEIVSGVPLGATVATAGSYVLAAQLNRGKLGAGCTDD